jgi:hypothetical protein
MYNEMMEDELYEKYVCVTHDTTLPCPFGEHHIVSNWPSDVATVLGKLKNDS